MSVICELAAAKVNLTLKVLGRRPDGYHQLHSVVAFAALGDCVRLDPSGPRTLKVRGPFADQIDGGNLIDAAIAGLLLSGGTGATIGAITLDKNLPVAAGLGGGSADAAATLRAIAKANPQLAGKVDWAQIARAVGADVSVCLAQRASHVAGLGEIVSPLAQIPPLPVVLVNPGVKLATAEVFAHLDAPRLTDLSGHGDHEVPPAMATISDVVDWIGPRANDLELPARRLAPIISDVLSCLDSASGVLLARLSGSGPTCFGLFVSLTEAEAAADTIRSRQPKWWVAASVLS